VLTRRFALITAILAVTGCSLDKQSAPDLTGPSEMGLSLAVTVTPDAITQNGQAQATVEIVARDAMNQPVRGLTLRLETLIPIDGGGLVPADFGTLSSKTASTGNDGRASVVYQAPPAPPPSANSDTTVTIAVTPVGTNYATSVARNVQIRLTRPGVILPPNGAPTADFFFSPSAPREADNVLFDGSGSNDPDGTIVSYAWNFGDGGTGSGVRATHAYDLAGSYTVTLTVTDDRGIKATAAKDVSVGAVSGPTAAFTVSPSAPIVGGNVNFNGMSSVASNGHHIASWAWDFGDGTPQASGATVQHAFDIEGSYTVTLVVTDDTGRTSVATKDVDIGIAAPKADFTFSPQTVKAGVTVVSFNASLSTAPPGRTITGYVWDFNDGGTSTASAPTHMFAVAGTYTVVLIVTDNTGATGMTSRSITVQP